MNPVDGLKLAALGRARQLGRISAYLCLCAALFIADGLQSLIREDFNQVALAIGGQAQISGVLPQGLVSHTELKASIESLPGLVFTPEESFKGFWMGATMWRGKILAGPGAVPGQGTLTIRDMVPAQNVTGGASTLVQNPQQVYTLNLWGSVAELQTAHNAFSHRFTGFSPFFLAGAALLLALGVGAGHVLLFHRVQLALADQGIFTVHGVLHTPSGTQALFSPAGRGDLRINQPVLLLSPTGEPQGQGHLIECGQAKYVALFTAPLAQPKYGWLLHCTAT